MSSTPQTSAPGSAEAVEAGGKAFGHTLYGIERVNALSDGLFAIVMTLIVLDLKHPEPTVPSRILDDLSDDYHVFIAWVISFMALARLWVVHHGITARMRFCHVSTIVLTLLFLGIVSLMPFTASLIGSYEVKEPWSTVFFAINLAAASLTLGLLAHHVTRQTHLLRPEATTGVLRVQRRHHLFVLPTVAATAVALAFLEPYAAITLMALEFVVVVAYGVRRA